MDRMNDIERLTEDQLSAGLSQAERDWRMERNFSDEEIRTQMSEQLGNEKALIRQAIANGEIYVVAGKDARRVHFHDCPSLRGQVDRERAWAEWFSWPVEDVRRMHAQAFSGPRMPDLVSRAHVEALSSYVTCQTCAPTVNHTKKSRGAVSTNLTSLSQRHIGRALQSLEGDELGTLLRIITTVDASGIHIAIETALTRLSQDDIDAVYVGGKPTDPDARP
jgi:hypothetical protein